MNGLLYALYVAKHLPVSMTVNDMKVYIRERRSSSARAISRQAGNGAVVGVLLARTRWVVTSDQKLGGYASSLY